MKCPNCGAEIDAIPMSFFKKSGKKGGKQTSPKKAKAAKLNASLPRRKLEKKGK